MNISSITGDLTYASFTQASHVIDESNDPEALNKAAQHFESLFIDMWLKSARESNRVISKDNPMRTPELEMHEEMRDHEVAVHLSKHGGIGLAEVIVKQLQGVSSVKDSELDQASTVQPLHTHGSSSLGSRKTAFQSPRQFAREMLPMIEAALNDAESAQPGMHNLPAMGVLSQAALETGWGGKVIADAQGNLTHNLFGLKSESLKEPHVRIVTNEFASSGWTREPARFRSYPDWQASIADYLSKLKNSERYADVMNTGDSVRSFAQSIAAAGYATDPGYADKIMNVYSKLQQLVAR